MAIKMKGTSMTYGKRGNAAVKLSKSGDVLLMKFEGEDNLYKVAFEKRNVPQPSKLNGRVYRVALDDTNASLRFITPIDDICEGMFVGFTRDGDDDIVLKEIEQREGVKGGKKWKIPQHMAFWARFFLPEHGIILPVELAYAFEDMGDGTMGLSGFGSGKLRRFMESTGIDFDKDTLPSNSEFVLEDLEKILLERKQKVKISISGGYVKDIAPYMKYTVLEIDENDDTEKEEEEEDLAPPTKSEKKPKKGESNVDALLSVLGYEPD